MFSTDLKKFAPTPLPKVDLFDQTNQGRPWGIDSAPTPPQGEFHPAALSQPFMNGLPNPWGGTEDMEHFGPTENDPSGDLLAAFRKAMQPR